MSYYPLLILYNKKRKEEGERPQSPAQTLSNETLGRNPFRMKLLALVEIAKPLIQSHLP
jgi:hypothetical protein